jgi:hypothetical protein
MMEALDSGSERRECVGDLFHAPWANDARHFRAVAHENQRGP